MNCFATERIKVSTDTCAIQGTVRWAPLKSIWTLFLLGLTLIAAPAYASWSAFLLFLGTSAVTLCLGHSLGMHRLLIHRSFETYRPIEYLFVYLGTLVGMAGPIGMIKTHELRDWAQRQRSCHDLFGHRRSFFWDAWWQMHCQVKLENPPALHLESRVANDRFYHFLERTWMLQQLPWALLFFSLGGISWVVWGIAVRVTVSLTGHWMVGHFAHRGGHQGWRVDGAAVQGFNIKWLGLITFGECWHANHHAFPGSAKLGIEARQSDPGWWVLSVMRRLGLAWNIIEPHHLSERPALHRVPDNQHALKGASLPKQENPNCFSLPTE